MTTFSMRLYEAMKLRKMSQIDLARASGIHHGTISNYCRGKYIPKSEKMTAIASALGVSVSYLAGYSDEPNPTGDPGLDAFLDTFTRMTQPGSFGPVSVTSEELRIVLAYREADPVLQAAVRRLLNMEDHGNAKK